MIAPLHGLDDQNVADLERQLKEWSRERPMALVIPALFSELEGDALPQIVDEIAGIDYLDEIIIGIDRADRDQFEQAKNSSPASRSGIGCSGTTSCGD